MAEMRRQDRWDGAVDTRDGMQPRCFPMHPSRQCAGWRACADACSSALISHTPNCLRQPQALPRWRSLEAAVPPALLIILVGPLIQAGGLHAGAPAVSRHARIARLSLQPHLCGSSSYVLRHAASVRQVATPTSATAETRFTNCFTHRALHSPALFDADGHAVQLFISQLELHLLGRCATDAVQWWACQIIPSGSTRQSSPTHMRPAGLQACLVTCVWLLAALHRIPPPPPTPSAAAKRKLRLRQQRFNPRPSAAPPPTCGGAGRGDAGAGRH